MLTERPETSKSLLQHPVTRAEPCSVRRSVVLAQAAVLRERRFEIGFDRSSGDYRLGVAASS